MIIARIGKAILTYAAKDFICVKSDVDARLLFIFPDDKTERTDK